MKIGNKTIREKVYVIAEFGVNHNGSLERAKEGIKAAADAGADAIKFQTYTADELVCKGTPKFWDAESKVDEGLDQYEAYKALEGFRSEWYPEIVSYCEELGIEFLSTPFSPETATFLNELGMKAFKVSSSDLSNLPFLRHIARFQKPMLISTGASTMDEIHEAVSAIEAEGNDQIILLHCTLCYPTKPEDANLNLLTTLGFEFTYPLGLSDHTLEKETSIAAVALGAVVLEKHFTVDKSLDKSADHWLSLDPEEMAYYTEKAHLASKLGGSFEKQIFDCEKETRLYDKRSIVSKVAIKEGQRITEDMITYKRPGTGIWPKDKDKVIGELAVVDIPADVPITFEMI